MKLAAVKHGHIRSEHTNRRGKKCSAESAEEKQAEHFSPAGADTPPNLFTPPMLEFIKDHESAKPSV